MFFCLLKNTSVARGNHSFLTFSVHEREHDELHPFAVDSIPMPELEWGTSLVSLCCH